MTHQHQIVAQLRQARDDPQAADAFIRQYLPLIRAETARVTRRIPADGDEELSVAMFAFYEAMLAYDPGKGAFLKLAALNIRHRLIDHHRRELRHSGHLSTESALREGEDLTLLDTLPDKNEALDRHQRRAATHEEIAEFSAQLESFGVSLSAVADACPRQERTRTACMAALDYARANPELLQQLLRQKKLPLAALCQGAGVERKTLERHRDYVLAILLAFTNGFEIIRGHLFQLQRKEGATT